MQYVNELQTYCIMINSLKRCRILLPILAMIATASSCIYDAPGDNFYRTLWVSDPGQPLGSVTLEFLCGGQVSIASPSAVGSFGYYETDGRQAWFTDLTLSKTNTTINILEARREGDVLHLTCFDETDLTQTVTEFHRLSAYPN